MENRQNLPHQGMDRSKTGQTGRGTKAKLPVEGRGAKLLKTNMAATILRASAAEDL